MSLSRLSLLGAAVAGTLAAAPGHGRAEEFRSGYTVSYWGMPLARSEFTSRFKGDRFSVTGRMSSSGAAKLFDSTEGSMKVTGRIRDGRAMPEVYSLNYKTEKKKKKTVIRFDGDRVKETENVPPLKKKRKDWVALAPEDLRAVTDPISATLVSAKSLNAVCDRTIRLYDGEMRADLKLSREGMEDWHGRKAVRCKARFVPVSGYKTGKRAIEYLRDRSEIAITFAALGKTGLYAPVHASVGTQIGTVTISADAPETTN